MNRISLLPLLFAAGAAVAQPYPSKPIRMIVPSAPGGRTGSRRMGSSWGGDGARLPGGWQGVWRWDFFALLLMILAVSGTVIAQPYPSKAIRMIVPSEPGGRTGSRRIGGTWGGDGARMPGGWQGVWRWEFVTLLLMILAVSGTVAAQPYPSKPIRMIVPSAPGSGPDIMARAIGQKLTEAWGQQVLVDARPGAGGIVGSEMAAKAAPDGYTLIMGNAGSHAVNPGLYPKLPYDPLRDFAPVTLVSVAPNVLIVHPSLPARAVKELVALARVRPGELTFGSGGNGSSAHLSGELFRTLAGIRIVHVPFKGAPAAVLGVMTGEISVAILNLPPALPHVKSGRLRALGVSTAQRSPAVPELPTIAEAGLPGYEATAWFGVLAPAGTPREIVTKLNGEIVKSLRTEEMAKRILADGGVAVGSTPEAFTEVMKRDIAKWAKVVQASGARAD